MEDAHQLGQRTWPEVARPIVLVPVGSCEQHGPHLPLDTDTQIATAIANGAALHIEHALVAPPVAYGSSGEHDGFAGTLSIGAAVTELLVVELARSAPWVDRLVFVNGHGGNLEPVRSAIELLRREGRRVDDWWPTGEPGDLHAGRVETSVMLHLNPSTVGDLPAGVVAPPIDALISDGVAAHSTSGVLGDPTGASADEGARILQGWIDDLVAMIVGRN